MPRPFPALAAPYEPRQPEPIEHDWYCTLADEVAERSASALAKGDMRLGVAHRYLAAAHIAALLEGGGPDVVTAFINDLLGDFEITS